jgi:hypothetical protein
MTFHIAGPALLLCLALAAAIPSAAAGATTVTVNTTIDLVQAGDGVCSLREATLYANGTAEPDCAAAPASGTTTIKLPAGLYRLRGQVLTLTGSATLIGAGAATTTVDAAGASQVFFIQDAAHVAISDVTITGGMSGQTTGTNPVFGLPGGGINNNGTLALERVIVTGNRTSPGATSALCTQIEGGCPGGNGGDGGGIDNAGTLTIGNSAITANSTGSGAAGTRGDIGSPSAPGSPGGPGGTSGDGGRGGGIANFQTLTITNSTIAGNTTGTGAPGADGGPGTRNHVGGNAASGGNGGSGAGILSGGQRQRGRRGRHRRHRRERRHRSHRRRRRARRGRRRGRRHRLERRHDDHQLHDRRQLRGNLRHVRGRRSPVWVHPSPGRGSQRGRHRPAGHGGHADPRDAHIEPRARDGRRG